MGSARQLPHLKLLAAEATTPTPAPNPNPGGASALGDGGAPPKVAPSTPTGVEPFARAGFRSLFVVVAAIALETGALYYDRAVVIRAFASIGSSLDAPTGQAASTTNPIVAGLGALLGAMLLFGVPIAALHYWHKRRGSIYAVGIALLLALFSVFTFFSELWTWKKHLDYLSAGQVLSVAFQQNSTWASLLGFVASIASAAFLAMGLKRSIEQKR
jgi:hypothetical protein